MFDAHLAIIGSREEHQFLSSKLNHCTRYWVGGLPIARGKMSFVWLDLTPLNYAPWFPGAPNDYEAKCSGLTVDKIFFHDDHCSEAHCLICQKFNENATRIFDEYPKTLIDYIANKMEKDEKLKTNVIQLLKRHKNGSCLKK
ncbi:C-type lectin domain family 4 member A-like isoform X1 [Dinothrombium tinctorium]|uniref:C-type lectin domain family 4 member A-like isoform X1 n=1 Tax=Dinothrombium tinctorium TaxID=1965070 RepID=A0A443RLH8_9ACAR|nr:C-type lectin domain family 4 member A-like isoform X1 [Dinothrombium tinctorium]